MSTFLQRQPALVGAILSLLGALAGIFIKSPELVAALVGIAAVFLGVRQVVTPVVTAVEKAAEAATVAATEVVRSLDSTVVGTVGEITGPAERIITSTVENVVGALK